LRSARNVGICRPFSTSLVYFSSHPLFLFRCLCDDITFAESFVIFFRPPCLPVRPTHSTPPPFFFSRPSPSFLDQDGSSARFVGFHGTNSFPPVSIEFFFLPLSTPSLPFQLLEGPLIGFPAVQSPFTFLVPPWLSLVSADPPSHSTRVAPFFFTAFCWSLRRMFCAQHPGRHLEFVLPLSGAF